MRSVGQGADTADRRVPLLDGRRRKPVELEDRGCHGIGIGLGRDLQCVGVADLFHFCHDALTIHRGEHRLIAAGRQREAQHAVHRSELGVTHLAQLQAPTLLAPRQHVAERRGLAGLGACGPRRVVERQQEVHSLLGWGGANEALSGLGYVACIKIQAIIDLFVRLCVDNEDNINRHRHCCRGQPVSQCHLRGSELRAVKLCRIAHSLITYGISSRSRERR